MVPFATHDDLAVRWRPLTAAEQATADALLVDASAMIRAQYPGIDDEITSGQLDPAVTLSVVCGMVKRAMIGSTVAAGASQTSETVGPYSSSVSYTNPAGNLYITATDDQFIRGYKPRGMSSTFSNTTCHREDVGPGFLYGGDWGTTPWPTP